MAVVAGLFRNIVGIAALVVIGCCPHVSAAEKEAKPSPITAAESRQRAAIDVHSWRERGGIEHPRLFLSREAYQALQRRYTVSTGRERELFDAVIERARDVAKRPVTEYRPPEDFISVKVSRDMAEAELWERSVGDDFVNSSLALILVDDRDMREKLKQAVLTACAYPTWGRSKSQHLAASHLLRGIAVAYDWHPDIWSGEEKENIRQAIRKHASEIAAGLYGGEFWAQAYQNNHNHVDISSLGLVGLAFLDDIPEAAEWLAAAETNFERVTELNNADGTTPEGISYWVYSINFIVQFIEGTRRILGTDRLYEKSFLKNAINYRLHGSTSGFDDVLPWGDVGDPSNAGFVLYALARQYRSAAGQYLGDQSPYRYVDGTPVHQICWMALWRDPSLEARPPEVFDYHFADADIVTSRSGWTEKDYLLSIKSGINNRNHGKLDAGALAVAFGGQWLLTAPRYGTGKADGTGGYWDFSRRRWTYFSCATESHSTLLVNGINQRFDPQARGTIDKFVSEGDWCWIGVDLTQAYAGTTSARREVFHRRGDYILIFDNVTLAESGTVEWLAQVPLDGEVVDGRVEISGRTGSLEIRPLFPAGAAFSSRQAQSPHFDVAERYQMKTFALKESGSAVRYVLAIRPSFSKRPSPLKSVDARETAEGFEVIVRGEDWTDRVVLDADSVHATRMADGKQTTEFSAQRR